MFKDMFKMEDRSREFIEAAFNVDRMVDQVIMTPEIQTTDLVKIREYTFLQN